MLSGLFLAFGVFDQKGQNFIRCDGLDFPVMEMGLKLVKK